jgi:probable rRNA maturation factor
MANALDGGGSVSFPQPEVDEGEDGSYRRFEVSNYHPRFRVNKRVLRRIMLEVLRAESFTYQELELILLTAEEMRRYNSEYHDEDSATDHLGFQYEAPTGKVSGDVLVCLDVCREQAIEYRQTFNRELARLVIHGILHLCGWQDHKPADRRKMAAREDQLLAVIEALDQPGRWIKRGLKNG